MCIYIYTVFHDSRFRAWGVGRRVKGEGVRKSCAERWLCTLAPWSLIPIFPGWAFIFFTSILGDA